MLSQPAKVIAVDGSSVVVETLSKLNCPRCEQGVGCGGGMIAKLFGDKVLRLTLSTELSLKPEQAISLTISEKLLLKASLTLYGVPLLFLIGSALAASFLASHEVFVILLSILGFVAGAYLSRVLALSLLKRPENYPVIQTDEMDGCYSEIS